MGLFDTTSKTIRHETNISKRITKTDTDVETVSGVKTKGDVTQAGGSIGLTGAQFASVANSLSTGLGQGVNALAAGAQSVAQEAREASANARQVATAAGQGRESPDDAGPSSAASGRPAWLMPAVVGVGLLAVLGAGGSLLNAMRG